MNSLFNTYQMQRIITEQWHYHGYYYFSLQPRPQYSPVTGDSQYGTYSPNTKRHFSPEVKKFTTLDSKRYSPDMKRYSPVVVTSSGGGGQGYTHASDNTLPPHHLPPSLYSPDPKVQRSQDNLDALVLRTESRASRGSVDSDRRKYSPHPLYNPHQEDGGTPQSQKRYLHNLMEGQY